MFAQVHCPQILLPAELDHYLEQGWFRMNQTIFTTNFLNFKDHFYSAIWLRVVLDEIVTDNTQQKLIRQNAVFRTEIVPATITPEKESLFERYKQSVSFEASASLQSLLNGKFINNVYNTYEIDVYDNQTLIAIGYFDIGKNSAAGISSFYDPAYKKYSLGKYLIYQKTDYCKRLNLQYFYPGYFVPGYSFFDYKLNMNKSALHYLQVSSQQWLPIHSFSSESIPLHVMEEKLQSLLVFLTQARIECRLMKYEFFDVNLLPDLKGAELFDFPILLYCFDITQERVNPIIVYDVRDQQYHVVQCRSVWAAKLQDKSEDTYASNLLKVDYELLSSANAGELASLLIGESSSIK